MSDDRSPERLKITFVSPTWSAPEEAEKRYPSGEGPPGVTVSPKYSYVGRVNYCGGAIITRGDGESGSAVRKRVKCEAFAPTGQALCETCQGIEQNDRRILEEQRSKAEEKQAAPSGNRRQW